MAVILFGLECMTTVIVLEELLAAGIDVRLVCLPGRRSMPLLRTPARRSLPMAAHSTHGRTVTTIAQSAGIEIWRIGDLASDETIEACQSVSADLVVVACYKQLLPAHVYVERRYGGVNVHPSLLPDKRGPDPLFWVFKQDDRWAGATVHRLSDGYDAGAILAQDSLPKLDGISENVLDVTLARLGSRLLLRTIENMRSGMIESAPQAERDATWAPFPTLADFHLDRSASARMAYNFVKGLAWRGHPITVVIDGRVRRVVDVSDWTIEVDTPPAKPNGYTRLRFANGWLVAALDEVQP